MKKFVSSLLMVIFGLNSLAAPALAAGSSGLGAYSLDTTGMGGGSEFVSGNYPGAILMPVNLWGSVTKPGIHHVPTKTDLLTLISLAGGPGVDAVFDEIVIKRRSGAEEKVLRVNGDDLLTKAGIHSPVLEANDIVIVPREKPPISNNTLTTISFFGTILSLVLTGYAVSKLGDR